MIDNCVKVRLFDELGKKFNREYNLNVSSVSEALHSININCKRKFYPWLVERDKAGIRYKIIINGQPFKTDLDINNNIADVLNTELIIKRENGGLKSIDIVPVFEGAGDDILGIFTVILGVVLIAVGLFAFGSTIGPGIAALKAGLVIAGIGLLAGGIINLLMRPPKFDDFREISAGGGKQSYLFNGPTNTINEGGPVPIGYGRLIVGSQVVSAAYTINNVDAGADDLTEIDTSPGAIDVQDQKKSGVRIVPPYPMDRPIRALDFTTANEIIVPIVASFAGKDVNGQKIQVPINKTIYSLDEKLDRKGFPAFLKTSSLYSKSPATLDDAKIYAFHTTGPYTNQCMVVGGNFNTIEKRNSASIYFQNLCIFYGGINGGFEGDLRVDGISANNTVYGVFIDAATDPRNIFVCGDFTTITSAGASINNTRVAKIVKSGNSYTATSLAGIASGGGANSTVRAITSDGTSIYVGGDFTSFNGDVFSARLAKLDATGALDGTFTQVTVDDNSVNDVKLDSNDKILICGNFTGVNADTAYKNICRINTNGSLDSTFVSPTLNGTGTTVRTVAIQSINGKILIGGKWDSITDASGTFASKHAARLNTDGTIDRTFQTRFDQGESTNSDDGVHKIIIRDTARDSGANLEIDGRIFMGGQWNSYDGYNFVNFVRLFNGDYFS